MRCHEDAALHTGFLTGRLGSLRKRAFSLPSSRLFLDYRWHIPALVPEPTGACGRDGDDLLRHGLHRVIATLSLRQERGLIHHVAVRVEQSHLVRAFGHRQNMRAVGQGEFGHVVGRYVESCRSALAFEWCWRTAGTRQGSRARVGCGPRRRKPDISITTA